MTAKNLDHLRGDIEILRYVKQKESELKELKEKSRAAIEAELGDAEWGNLDGEPAIHWSSFKRTILDQKAIKEHEPEIVALYMKTNIVRKMEIL